MLFVLVKFVRLVKDLTVPVESCKPSPYLVNEIEVVLPVVIALPDEEAEKEANGLFRNTII